MAPRHRGPSRRAVVAALAGACLAPPPARGQPAPALWPDPTDPSVTLDDVDQAVDRVFKVARVDCAELAEMLPAGRIVPVDVREPPEFELSRLPGAILASPDITPEAFYDTIAPQLAGRAPVFYCSVGIRSARLLAALDWDLYDHPGPARCLRGGLFRWCQEGRELVDGTGRAVRAVHPKDDGWGRLLARLMAGRG